MIMDHPPGPPGLLFVPCFSGSKRPLLAPEPGGRNYSRQLWSLGIISENERENIDMCVWICICNIHFIFFKIYVFIYVK